MFSTYLAIGLYFAILLGIGKFSYRKNSNLDEYLLDNRSLNPLMTALSAGASDMSGWMLLGLPGALYLSGICSAWIAVGLSVGAWANYRFLAKRLRIYTEVCGNAITIPDFLENRFKDKSKLLRTISAVFILIFFTLYVSSGIIAGGKTFESFFGLDFAFGALLALVIVVFYTFAGGFKAVCITDAFQGTLMFVVLVAVPLVAWLNLKAPFEFFTTLKSIAPTHLDFFANQSFLSVLGLLAWGFGYFGQPHIIVRFMAIRDARELDSARRIGILWMVLGLLGAIVSGLLGVVFFAENGGALKDAETVFLKLGETLFHPFFVGVIISAVLAAIISTMASQLLVSASSATKDFYFVFFGKELSEKEQVFSGRIAVVVVAVVSTAFAFASSETVLNVVGYAWAGFGAVFGPVLLFSLYSKKMNTLAALVGMVVGGATVIVWIVSGLSSFVYELLPGFLFSAVAIWLVNFFSGEVKDEQIKAEFEKMHERVKLA